MSENNEENFMSIISEYIFRRKDDLFWMNDEGKLDMSAQWFSNLETETMELGRAKFEKLLAGALSYYYKDDDNIRGSAIEDATKKLFMSGEDIEDVDIDKYIENNILNISFCASHRNGQIKSNPLMFINGYGKRNLAVYMEEPNTTKDFDYVTLDKLYELIIKGMNYNPNSITKVKSNDDIITLTKPSIKEIFEGAAHNFIQYCDYFIEEHSMEKTNDEDIIDINEVQDSDIVGKYSYTTNEPKGRVNPEIPYSERQDIMKKAGLTCIARINRNENNSNDSDSTQYDAYSSEFDKNGGILIWLEPISGMKDTRIAYCSREKLENIFETKQVDNQIDEKGLSADQKKAVASYYYKMSQGRYKKEPNAITSRHTTLDTFQILAQSTIKRSHNIDFSNMDITARQQSGYVYRAKKRLNSLFGEEDYKKVANSAKPELISQAEEVMADIIDKGDIVTERGNN